jgi:hypothetical protein
MSLAGMEELSHITGPAFANAVADDLGWTAVAGDGQTISGSA